MPAIQQASENTESSDILTTEEASNILGSEPQSVLKVFSGPGAHYLHQPGDELVAVYAGPHGPENRPAIVDQETLHQLLQVAEKASFVDLGQSPFAETWL